MAEQNPQTGQDEASEQAQQQTGRRQVTLHVNDQNLQTHYTNAFRTNTTAEEVIIDFGMNMIVPEPQQQQQSQQGNQPDGRMLFNVDNRLVMNYYTAKRLAMMLSQVVRQHEERYGELKLNAADRLAGGQQGQQTGDAQR
jgi:hypothetical protein